MIVVVVVKKLGWAHRDWKNHPDAWPELVEPDPDDENEPNGIQIGKNFYSKQEVIDWLKSPVKEDKSITMFKAFIATYLNLLDGNCWADCLEYYPYIVYGEELDAYEEGYDWLVEFPVGSGVRAKSEAWQYSHGESIYWYLDDYNNGLLCAASRD